MQPSLWNQIRWANVIKSRCENLEKATPVDENIRLPKAFERANFHLHLAKAIFETTTTEGLKQLWWEWLSHSEATLIIIHLFERFQLLAGPVPQEIQDSQGEEETRGARA